MLCAIFRMGASVVGMYAGHVSGRGAEEEETAALGKRVNLEQYSI